MRPQKDRSVVPSEDSERFLTELGAHTGRVHLRATHWSNRPSPHMTPALMFDLARDVNRALEEPDVRGAVVIHGTDVLVESAFMADITVRSAKPVVYTGSMRFYSETGYDGIRNLLNAIKACLLPLPPDTGVVLLMTDRFFTAREVIKINSLNIDAFGAPESGPVGYVAGDSVLLTRRIRECPRPTTRQVLHPESLELRVPLVRCYTGMDAGIIEYLSQLKMAGLVVEGFGAGNVPPAIVTVIEDLAAQSIPVVLTTQCPEGGVWPIYGYPGGGADLKKRGILSGGRLTGAKARLLLMAALGEKRDMQQIRKLFAEY